MCTLNKVLNDESAIVYKYAAKHNETGRYYSPCTGIEYKNGPVEIPTVQKSIDQSYHPDIIIPGSIWYREEMVGRTAGFEDLSVAQEKARFNSIIDGYTAVVLKIRLSKELMSGIYNWPDEYIVAGKEIEILEEVS